MQPFLLAIVLLPPADLPAVERVGEVRVEGYTLCRRDAVIAVTGLEPGAWMPSAVALLAAEVRLLVTFPDRLDLTAGRRPTVAVEGVGGSQFRDVVIRFPEKGK